MFSDRKHSGVKFPRLLEFIRQTQSFEHISDDVIWGWVLGHLEMDLFFSWGNFATVGSLHREKIKRRWVSTSRKVNCSKCKGRGWFGKGRPDCPRCVAVGKEPEWIERSSEWAGDEFTEYDKRRLIFSMYELRLIDRFSNAYKWADRIEKLLDNRCEHIEPWVKSLEIHGQYSAKEKKEIMERIKCAFTSYPSRPLMEGKKVLSDDVQQYGLDIHFALIRLALTFGCTCPITGEYLAPSQLNRLYRRNNESGYCEQNTVANSEWTSCVKPLGFNAGKRIETFDDSVYFEIHPFSKTGIGVINRAANKCLKVMGEISDEWILAEVMQSALLRRAA